MGGRPPLEVNIMNYVIYVSVTVGQISDDQWSQKIVCLNQELNPSPSKSGWAS